MDSNRKTAIIAGVLFLTVLVSSMLSGAFSRSIDDPDYLIAVSEDEHKVLMGVPFMVTLTASVVAIPIVMFPVSKSIMIVKLLGMWLSGFLRDYWTS